MMLEKTARRLAEKCSSPPLASAGEAFFLCGADKKCRNVQKNLSRHFSLFLKRLGEFLLALQALRECFLRKKAVLGLVGK